ncbi:MAG: formyltetrahydrofolate deformylase [Phenylobacterium sp.]|jgi:formyltetrahydrofolate deformylase|uniref:formyltetrahydrofolate deformylase n=1 Tax=Phenylobacterium sp. TaxID=1871053 RepID=UPI002A359518|nr:formyltetrahydrofolate deformylase [Phenylobacterium sp.]MDX9996763.1 formyltetrahydrofolate deformylase [Phenylobacterium sp.]
MPTDITPPLSPERPTAPLLLTLSCPDRIGIVADVASFLVENGCNIVESAQYGDHDNGRFFLRTGFESLSGRTLPELEAAFAPIAARHGMDARFWDASRKTPTLIMVSRFGHCLNDLLFRWRIGALPIEVKAVVSNHADFRDLVEQAGLPFHHLPVTPQTKPQQEAALEALVADLGVELIVLARYMQILSPQMCARQAGRIINIHHSFLPSFVGARPYHAAHARGVKLIGATAHYVTEDLDEGPIIEQAVERVSHSHSVADYIAVGRDLEALVLARAVKWHAEHRVLLNGRRTVIFH